MAFMLTSIEDLFHITRTVVPLLFATFFTAFLSKYYLASRRPRNFPPGPPTLPFIGNLHQLPLKKAFLKFHELSKEYGTIIGLKVGLQNIVILNSYTHVKEQVVSLLLDKRGAIYSSRPPNHIANKILFPTNEHMLLAPYGPSWKTARRHTQVLLNAQNVDSFLPLQNAEALHTISQLLESPENYYDHMRRYSTSVMLAMVYGRRARSFDEERVKRLYSAQDKFTGLLEQGATPPIDAFPFLKWFPGSWRARAKRVREEQGGLYSLLLEETRTDVEGGQDSGFIGEILRGEHGDMSNVHLAYFGGAMLEAGSDTTSATLLSFLLAMIKNPEIFKKAQEEADRCCGPLRSPNEKDIEYLPYLHACMLEESHHPAIFTERWRPIVPGGVPHMLMQDDTYQSYFLPKGTIFLINSWAIHRNEEEFDNSDAFVPECWLGSEFGTRNPVLNDSVRRVHYGFGAGRRYCPGVRLAENSLMINMAKLVWAFDLESLENEVDDHIETAFVDGFSTCPKIFPIRFNHRSREHDDTLRKEIEGAKLILEKYEANDGK